MHLTLTSQSHILMQNSEYFHIALHNEQHPRTSQFKIFNKKNFNPIHKYLKEMHFILLIFRSRCSNFYIQKTSIKNTSETLFHLHIITHWTFNKFTLTYFIYFIPSVHLILLSNMLIISDHT